MTTPLAPVYLDDQPVPLEDEPRPNVSKVLAATGRLPRSHVRLVDDDAGASHAIDADYVLDRTAAPTQPIYLTTVEEDDVEAVLEGDGFTTVGGSPGIASGANDGAAVAATTGVSGEGNERGSPQSAYSRTGTDTATPGMTHEPDLGFGSGAGEGTSSGARQSGKAAPNAAPPATTAAPPTVAPGPNDRFGQEGLGGRQGQGPLSLHSEPGPLVEPADPNGTDSEDTSKPSDPEHDSG